MDLLRRAFRDISAGSTRGTVLSKTCWIKHLSYADQIGFDNRREEFFNEAKVAGLPTNDEKLAILRKQGFWTDEKDFELKRAEQYIVDLHEAKKKNAAMPSLVKSYVAQIDKAEKEHEVKLIAKRRLLELTCEVFSERCVNDHYIISNLFADSALSHPMFSAEEFDWFRDEEVGNVVRDYNVAIEGCSETNIKKLAMQGFFQRYFQLTGDNLSQFFAKPICELTFYQVDLLRYGAHFRSIYSTHDVSTWDKKVLDDPDLMSEYANSVTKGKEEMSKVGANEEGVSVVGMKNEDRKVIGVTSNMKALNDMAKLGR